MPYRLLEDEIESTDSSATAPEEESGLQFAGRTAARTLARGAEAIAGTPADILTGAHSLIKKLLPSYGAVAEKENLPNILPTSENIRKHGTQALTGQELEPKNESERFYDDIIEDAATLFLPTRGKVPFKKAVLGSLGKSAVGNFAKWGSEEVTGSPLAGAAAKIGSIALASTVGGRKELNKVKSESYNSAYSKIPQGARFDFSPERKKIHTLTKSLVHGDHPDKKFIQDRIQALDELMNAGGHVNPLEVIQLKQDWNAHLRDNISPRSKDILGESVKVLNEGISRYGAKNPSFYTPYKTGEELTRALNSSSIVQRVISSSPHLKESYSNPIVKTLLRGGGVYGLGHLTGLPAAVGLGGAAYAANEGARAFQLLSRSPHARKYYFNVVKDALNNDKKALARSLKNLDSAADKFTENEPDQEDMIEQVEANEPKARYRLLD